MGQVSGIGAGHSDETMQPEQLHGHLKMVYAAESVVYEVVDRPLRVSETPELIVNGDLEQPLTDGAPPGWTVRNKPLLDTSTQQAWHSTTAVGTTGDDWIEQTVAVEASALYIFRVLARATEKAQFAVYEVEWQDASGQPLSTFQRIMSSPVDWYPRATAVTSPPGAARARIRAASTGPNLIWFDWFSFKKLSYR
jgi:hypothetical protein